MAGINVIKVGDKIPVLLQLADGATDQYPQAEIRDHEDGLLVTLDMVHLASGLYVEDEVVIADRYEMPDKELISIVYIVYTDALHNTESLVYERDADAFTRLADTNIEFLIKIIKNKKVLVKTGAIWQLIIYDDDDITPILSKDILDMNGNNITDLEAGVLAQELKTSV